MDSNQQQPRRRSERRQANRRRQEQQQLERQQSEQQVQNVSSDNINGPQQLIRSVMDVEQVQINQPLEESKMNINKEESKQKEKEEEKVQNPIDQIQNIMPQRFLIKIPNLKVIREFFINQGSYYTPPLKDLTNEFCRKVLNGEKKLLKLKQVLFVEQVPNWPEFSSKHLYEKAMSTPAHSGHVYHKGILKFQYKTLKRKYLLNVVNTVHKNSVINEVFRIRKQREELQIDEQPIQVTNEFAQLLQNFVSVSCDQSRKGLRLAKPKQFNQCVLCLQLMKRQDTISNFACLRHKSHKKCIMKYVQSEIGGKAQIQGYLCPLKCKKPS